MHKKYILLSVFIAVFLAISLTVYYEYHFATKLVRYRSTSNIEKIISCKNPPSLKGFSELNISGSREPTKYTLQKLRTVIKGPVFIFDLLSENHYFIKGMPERWYGYEATKENIIPMEETSLRKILHRIIFTGKIHHTKDEMQTEKELVEGCGFKYVVLSRARKDLPTKDEVDDFIKKVESLPKNSWVHFHCLAGRGRTTVTMVMFDILKNGKEVSLQDIVRRHHLIGSEDLFDTSVWPQGRYTKEMLESRKNFIIIFYNYVNDPKGYGTKTWSEWSKDLEL